MTTAPNQLRRSFVLKPLHLIGIAMIVLAVVLGYLGLQSAFRPYTTSVAEAKGSGRGVQLAGFLVPGEQGSYDATGNFTFQMQDGTGNVVKIVYPKPRPANFEQAISIVAIGRYDAGQNVFLADDMLVKCPSKYQEQLGNSSQ
jgi:cytochrome c-type biogenesis protein CcmE